MSIVSFIKDAGEHLFKRPPMAPPSIPVRTTTATAPAAPVKPTTPDLAALNRTAADSIKRYVASKGLPTDKLSLSYDGASSTVTVPAPYLSELVTSSATTIPRADNLEPATTTPLAIRALTSRPGARICNSPRSSSINCRASNRFESSVW